MSEFNVKEKIFFTDMMFVYREIKRKIYSKNIFLKFSLKNSYFIITIKNNTIIF